MANKEEQQVVGQAPQAPAPPTPTAPVGQVIGGQGAQSSYVPGMVNGPQTEMASAMRIGNEAMSNAGADLATNRASMTNPASVPIFPKDTSAVTAPSVYPTSEAIGRGFAAGVEHAGAGIANAAEGAGRFGLGIANTFIQNARNMIGVAKHLAAPAVHGFTAGMGGDETSYNQAQQASIGSPQQDRPTATVATMTPQQKLDVLKRRHAMSQTPGDPGISPVGVNVPDIPAALAAGASPEKAAETGATDVQPQQQAAGAASGIPAADAQPVAQGRWQPPYDPNDTGFRLLGEDGATNYPSTGRMMPASAEEIARAKTGYYEDAGGAPIDIVRGTIGQRVHGASPEFGGTADAVSVDPALQSYIERAEGALARSQPSTEMTRYTRDENGNVIGQSTTSTGFQGDPQSLADAQAAIDADATDAIKAQAAIDAIAASGGDVESNLEFMGAFFGDDAGVDKQRVAAAAGMVDKMVAAGWDLNAARLHVAERIEDVPMMKDFQDGGSRWKDDDVNRSVDEGIKQFGVAQNKFMGSKPHQSLQATGTNIRNRNEEDQQIGR